MNRRTFLQSTAIIAAPAFISSSGLFRGATDVWVPDKSASWLKDGLTVYFDLEAGHTQRFEFVSARNSVTNVGAGRVAGFINFETNLFNPTVDMHAFNGVSIKRQTRRTC